MRTDSSRCDPIRITLDLRPQINKCKKTGKGQNSLGLPD